ncbi:MAG: hypothetical protein ACTTIX_09255 [Peptoanaerobacter stomatis]|jgi:hypothetical protein
MRIITKENQYAFSLPLYHLNLKKEKRNIEIIIQNKIFVIILNLIIEKTGIINLSKFSIISLSKDIYNNNSMEVINVVGAYFANIFFILVYFKTAKIQINCNT